ncbi:hypothetical protein F4802DRAFT_570453 [Xylaria palmicola]|nr:hypothetical protein F4802DRAFT_570453 [Xylaria palmicola]
MRLPRLRVRVSVTAALLFSLLVLKEREAFMTLLQFCIIHLFTFYPLLVALNLVLRCISRDAIR